MATENRSPYERLPVSRFVPAPGQGALAVTALDGEFADHVRERADHPRTRVETTAEREPSRASYTAVLTWVS